MSESKQLTDMDSIMDIAELLCKKVSEYGKQALVLTVDPVLRTCQTKTTDMGRLFLVENNDLSRKFQEFCVSTYLAKMKNKEEEKTQHCIGDQQVNQETMNKEDQSRTIQVIAEVDSQSKEKDIIKDLSDGKPTTEDNSLSKKGDEDDLNDNQPMSHSDSCSDQDVSDDFNEDISTDDYTVETLSQNRRKKKVTQIKTIDHDSDRQLRCKKTSFKSKKSAKQKNLDKIIRSFTSIKSSDRNVGKETKPDVKPSDLDAEVKEMSSNEKDGSASEETNSDTQIGIQTPLVVKRKGKRKIKGNERMKIKGREKKSTEKIKCSLCFKLYASEQSLGKHMRSHKGYKYCIYCKKWISIVDQTLESHIQENHKDDMPYKCDICNRGFKSGNGIQQHVIGVHGSEQSSPFWCKFCSRAFSSQHRYDTHMLTHTAKQRCFMCKFFCYDLKDLKSHMEKSHANFLCLVCKRYFADAMELKIHESNHTIEEKEMGVYNDITEYTELDDSTKEDLTKECTDECSMNDLEDKVVENTDENKAKGTKSKVMRGKSRFPLKCKFCGKVFRIALAFQRHIALHNNESGDNFKCNHCEKQFKNVESFKLHQISHLPDKLKPHQCEECGKGFATRTILNKHSLVHSGLKPFVCEKCGKSFREAAKLKVHSRVHSGERPYSCKECGKTYRSRDAQRAHIRSHQIKNPYMCEICGQAYTQLARLKIHRRSHMEDGLKCDVCGVEQTSVRAITRHLIVAHTEIAEERGIKIHKCEPCKEIFPDKARYDMHMLKHSGERPFSCVHCNKGFQNKKNLRAHLRIHKQDLKYSCNVCKKRFLYNRTLKKHIASHRNNDNVNEMASASMFIRVEETDPEESTYVPNIGPSNEDREYIPNTGPSNEDREYIPNAGPSNEEREETQRSIVPLMHLQESHENPMLEHHGQMREFLMGSQHVIHPAADHLRNLYYR